MSTLQRTEFGEFVFTPVSRKPAYGAGEGGNSPPPPVKLYIGAGGGGDTVAAAVRALSETGTRYVLGAGYAYEEYVKALTEGNKHRPPKEGWAREPANAGKEAIEAYINSVIEKQEDGIFKLLKPGDDSEELKDAVFKDKKRNERKGADSSYKYRSLLEESTFLNEIKMGDVECFMAATAEHLGEPRSRENGDKEHDYVSAENQYAALNKFVLGKNINEIIVMDFGGDIFDLKETMTRARDGVFLTLLVRLLLDNPAISMRVEVYGPGVDMHEGPAEVLCKLRAMKPTSIASDNSMYRALQVREDVLVKLGVLGMGRATANWFAAVKMEEDYINKYLKKRDDYKKLIVGEDAPGYAELRKEAERLVNNSYMYSAVYTFKGNADYFKSLLPPKSAAARYIQSIEA